MTAPRRRSLVVWGRTELPGQDLRQGVFGGVVGMSTQVIEYCDPQHPAVHGVPSPPSSASSTRTGNFGHGPRELISPLAGSCSNCLVTASHLLDPIRPPCSARRGHLAQVVGAPLARGHRQGRHPAARRALPRAETRSARASAADFIWRLRLERPNQEPLRSVLPAAPIVHVHGLRSPLAWPPASALDQTSRLAGTQEARALSAHPPSAPRIRMSDYKSAKVNKGREAGAASSTDYPDRQLLLVASITPGRGYHPVARRFADLQPGGEALMVFSSPPRSTSSRSRSSTAA